MLEREYKLEFEGKHVKDDLDFLELTAGLGLVPGASGSKDLVSIYFDTDDFRLLRLGVGLRFRYLGGKDKDPLASEGSWGIKTIPLLERSGAVARHEFEEKGVAAHPPTSLFEPLNFILGSLDRLSKIAEIYNHRSWIRFNQGALEVFEIDKDRVEIRYPHPQRYLEVEVEALNPRGYSFCDKVAAAMASFGGTLTSRSKLEKALSMGGIPEVPHSLGELKGVEDLRRALGFELWLHKNTKTPYGEYIEQLLIASAIGVAVEHGLRTEIYWVALGFLLLARDLDLKDVSSKIDLVNSWVLDLLLIGDSVNSVDHVSSIISEVGRQLPIDTETYWVYEVSPLEYVRQVVDRGVFTSTNRLFEMAAELQLGAVAALREYLLS